MKRSLMLNSAPVEHAACRVEQNSTALVPLARPISVRIDAALSCNLAKERSLIYFRSGVMVRMGPTGVWFRGRGTTDPFWPITGLQWPFLSPHSGIKEETSILSFFPLATSRTVPTWQLR